MHIRIYMKHSHTKIIKFALTSGIPVKMVTYDGNMLGVSIVFNQYK
jgi:hypothetical protein